ELQDSICQQLIGEVIIAQGRPVSITDIERITLQKVEYNETAKQQLAQWRMEHGLINVPSISNTQRASLADKLKGFWEKQRKAIAYSVGCIVIIGAVFTAQYLQNQRAAVHVSQEGSATWESNEVEL